MGVILPKKALVTGGAGFLRSLLCKRLLDKGYEVKCLDNLFTGTKRNITDLLPNERFMFVEWDIMQSYRRLFDAV